MYEEWSLYIYICVYVYVYKYFIWMEKWQKGIPDSKVHGTNMGPTWVQSAPGGPHVGPMNLAIRDYVDIDNIFTNVYMIFLLMHCLLKCKADISRYWITFKWQVNPLHAEAGRFREKQVTAMAADALAPCISRTSAAMILTKLDNEVFQEEGFQLPAIVVSRNDKMENI